MGAYNLMKQPWQPTSPVPPPSHPETSRQPQPQSPYEPLALPLEKTKPRRLYIIVLDDFLTVPTLQLAADTVRTLTEHLTKVDKEDDTAHYDIIVKYTTPEMDELMEETRGCTSVNFFVITGKITTLQASLTACRDACPQVPKSFVSLHEGSQVSYFKHLLRQWRKDGSYPFSCEALQMAYKE
ncbi:hypothetical protein BDN72DRAFT_844553 [Pluteus cervinus]|uniref:Uncharacterized protein n=1 Tax=Pluteus cervinus TaxID=181527 RepID=A0ACD3AKL0_9AGAR|nr:hypothetical protein BDN72DRAFT_844553 [Pluteus cervinus]